MNLTLILLGVCLITNTLVYAEKDGTPEFVKIKSGSFLMGADLPENYLTAEKAIFIQDELPSRKVLISYDFEIGKYEITNAQYELFNPEHSKLRGKAHRISSDDNEAVVYVSWDDAINYCNWLSENDRKYTYRLPTEAEWEYSCRAGTVTPFYNNSNENIYTINPFGEISDSERIITEWVTTRGNKTTRTIAWDNIEDADLTVGREGPNPWGLYDMMGNVQEWCMDWYGPYQSNDTIDPVGYVNGSTKAVRGGSHSVYIQTHRSANRLSSSRSDSHFLMGFRVVRVPKGKVLPEPKLKQPEKKWAENVSTRKYYWKQDLIAPYFEIKELYNIESEYGSRTLANQFKIPLYTHNHSPAITWCNNGDILMIWFTGESEKGQELSIVGLRGRRSSSGELIWDNEVSEFYKEADRNVHGSQLWNNAVRLQNGFREPFTLYHLNGLSTDGKWGRLAQIYRKSTDNGSTWSEPTVIKQGIDNFHLAGDRNQPQGNAFTMKDGSLISFSDGAPEDGRGSTVNISNDGGMSWKVNTLKDGPPGIHTNGVELNDGSILTITRDKGETYGTMPFSISNDHGKTFTSTGSEFPGIGTVQRSALIRLEYSDPDLDPEKKGRKPILLISMANDSITANDANGIRRYISGTFAALSWDEGKTWPLKRVLSNVKSGSALYNSAPWDKKITLDSSRGQQEAYWAATQSPDGIIYLSDSRLMYSFNLGWLINGY